MASRIHWKWICDLEARIPLQPQTLQLLAANNKRIRRRLRVLIAEPTHYITKRWRDTWANNQTNHPINCFAKPSNRPPYFHSPDNIEVSLPRCRNDQRIRRHRHLLGVISIVTTFYQMHGTLLPNQVKTSAGSCENEAMFLIIWRRSAWDISVSGVLQTRA